MTAGPITRVGFIVDVEQYPCGARPAAIVRLEAHVHSDASPIRLQPWSQCHAGSTTSPLVDGSVHRPIDPETDTDGQRRTYPAKDNGPQAFHAIAVWHRGALPPMNAVHEHWRHRRPDKGTIPGGVHDINPTDSLIGQRPFL